MQTDKGRIVRGLPAHSSDLDAHTKSFWEILRTGEYHGLMAGRVNDPFALVANTLYAIPIVVPRDITVDRIAMEVTSLVNPSNIRLGIYNDGTNLHPGTLLLDAGVVSGATTGVKAITISQALTKGIYHLALVTDAAPSAVGSNGYALPCGVRESAFAQGYPGWSVGFTYAALPTPFPAATLVPNNMGAILVRIASLD